MADGETPDQQRASEAAERFRKEIQALARDHNLTEDEFYRRLLEAFSAAAPQMTEEEVSRVMDNLGQLLYRFDEELARRGMARPGNNPEKPN